MPKSLMDTDFYILTMMQAIFHRYTHVETEFEFRWRNWDQMDLRIDQNEFLRLLNHQLDEFCSLRFTVPELKYLYEIPFFKADFIEYLRLYQPNRNYIHAYIRDQQLAIHIKGPALNTITFEVPTLSSVSQIYTENTGQMGFNWLREGRKNLESKLTYLENHLRGRKGFGFADFGTRRRAHVDWHSELLDIIIDRCPQFLTGTSNVMFAMQKGLKYIGTMAHFWFQLHQQLGPRLADSQSAALQAWADEYRGELGIALSDIFGFDAFMCDFDRYFALLFDGCRHDSGDPYDWCEKLIFHYLYHRIDPKTKTAIFSDGLTFEQAVGLFNTFHSKINTGFGIGTYLTNDCGFIAPQIVIKNTKTNGKPTAKVPDSPGKGMCTDDDYETYLRKVIREKIDDCIGQVAA